MNWDWIKDLAESRPKLAAAVTMISLLGAGVGAVANGVDFLDIVGGKASEEKVAKAAAEAREAKAVEALAQQARDSATAQADAQAWTTAVQTNTTAAYDFYLQTYPTGRFKTHAEDARTRLASAQDATVTRPFDVARLHPTVAAAVAAARDAAKDAAAKQTQAERTSNMAVAAASQARAGARNYDVIRFRDRDTYEGEVAGGKAQGLGVYVQGDAKFAGDKFQGQHAAGLWNGVGVFESASGEPGRPARYAGEFTGGQLAGMGVIMRSNGVRQSGTVVDGALTGPGVETRADGERIEGEFRGGAPDGFAARWSADGRVIEAGRYEQGRLVQPLGQ